MNWFQAADKARCGAEVRRKCWPPHLRVRAVSGANGNSWTFGGAFGERANWTPTHWDMDAADWEVVR